MSDFDKVLKDKPLLAFSLYSSLQADILTQKGRELNSLSKKWKSEIVTDFNEYYGNFWLWLLGAYEVIRTIASNQDCFVDEKAKQAENLKSKLADLRIPFAKQEIKGRKGPIWGELSVVGIERGMVFEVSGKKVHTEDLIEAVLVFFESLELSDVLSRIPEAEPPNGAQQV